MTETAARNKLSLRPDYWRRFAADAAKDNDCPLYEHLSLAIADDPAMQAVTLPARLGQPPANILFGAVHFVLLGGVDHALRRYYPHLLKPGETEQAIGSETYAVFQDFVAHNRDVLDPLIARRVTNTNEVRRCSYLRAGYVEIASRAARPLHMIEIGPSAGLNMNWDRYGYEYIHADGRSLKGGPASTLIIDSAWRGAVPPPVPASPPQVAARIGLEMNPVDLSSEADRRWLLALLWPGRTDRIERMRKALAIAEVHVPPIRSGDALVNLPEELGQVMDGTAAVVVHSMVTYQWHEEMRARLETILTEASHRRPIYRLFQDTIDRESDPGRHPLRLRTYRNGIMDEVILADAHHHGSWIAWQA